MVFLIWLSVLLGPTYLPRYVLIFWFGLPLFAAVMLEEEKFIRTACEEMPQTVSAREEA